jgi:hypothetical protein
MEYQLQDYDLLAAGQIVLAVASILNLFERWVEYPHGCR